jgi:hypothetical protein
MSSVFHPGSQESAFLPFTWLHSRKHRWPTQLSWLITRKTESETSTQGFIHHYTPLPVYSPDLTYFLPAIHYFRFPDRWFLDIHWSTFLCLQTTCDLLYHIQQDIHVSHGSTSESCCEIALTQQCPKSTVWPSYRARPLSWYESRLQQLQCKT